MTDKLKEAIEVLKKHRYEHLFSTGTLGKAIDTVVAELEKHTYTPADMDSFAEWCRIEGFFYEVDNKIWCNYDTEPITEKTTTQLREDWEAKQRGEVKPLKCIRCGKELDKDKIVLNSFGNKDNNPDVVFCSDCEHLNYIEHLQQGKEATE